MMDMKKIGAFLKELRREKGLTQEQLAEILLVSGRTISRWETGTNMPDLSILIQMAEFYDVEVKEILDGERRNGNMEKEMNETLSKAADYSRLEKEKAMKAGNIAFSLIFFTCAAAIVVQLVITGMFTMVLGETVTLLAGGIVYIAAMVHGGVWESGTESKSTLWRDVLISVVCSEVFTVILVFCYIRLGAGKAQTAYIAVLFSVGTAIAGFALLRVLTYCNRKRRAKRELVTFSDNGAAE